MLSGTGGRPENRSAESLDFPLVAIRVAIILVDAKKRFGFPDCFSVGERIKTHGIFRAPRVFVFQAECIMILVQDPGYLHKFTWFMNSPAPRYDLRPGSKETRQCGRGSLGLGGDRFAGHKR